MLLVILNLLVLSMRWSFPCLSKNLFCLLLLSVHRIYWMSIFGTSLLISWNKVFKILIICAVIWILLAIHIHLIKLIKAGKVLNGAMNVGITPSKILKSLTRKLCLRLSNDLFTLSWSSLRSSTRSRVTVGGTLINTLEWVKVVYLEVLLRLRGSVCLIGCLLHYQLSLLLGQLSTNLRRTSIRCVLLKQELLQIIIIQLHVVLLILTEWIKAIEIHVLSILLLVLLHLLLLELLKLFLWNFREVTCQWSRRQLGRALRL